MEIFIQLPNEKEPLILKGKVIWTNLNGTQKGSASNVALGIKFEDVAPHHHVKLTNFIEQFDKDGLKA